jgi:hypothetical protein
VTDAPGRTPETHLGGRERCTWADATDKPDRHRGVKGHQPPHIGQNADVYFTDRGIEELAARRGEEQVSLEWLAEQLRTFVDVHPDFETPIERLATWLARLDDDED